MHIVFYILFYSEWDHDLQNKHHVVLMKTWNGDHKLLRKMFTQVRSSFHFLIDSYRNRLLLATSGVGDFIYSLWYLHWRQYCDIWWPHMKEINPEIKITFSDSLLESITGSAALKKHCMSTGSWLEANINMWGKMRFSASASKRNPVGTVFSHRLQAHIPADGVKGAVGTYHMKQVWCAPTLCFQGSTYLGKCKKLLDTGRTEKHQISFSLSDEKLNILVTLTSGANGMSLIPLPTALLARREEWAFCFSNEFLSPSELKIYHVLPPPPSLSTEAEQRAENQHRERPQLVLIRHMNGWCGGRQGH